MDHVEQIATDPIWNAGEFVLAAVCRMPGKPIPKQKKVEQPQNFFPVNMGLLPAPDTIPINTRGTFVDLETGKKKRAQFRGFVTPSGIKWWTFVNSGKTNDNMFKKMDMLHAVKANPEYASRWEFLVDPEIVGAAAPAPAAPPEPVGGAGPAEGQIPNWFRRRNILYNPEYNELVLPNATPEVSPVSTIDSLALSTNNENNVLALLNSPVVNKPTRKNRKGRKARKVTRRSRRS